MGVYAFSLPRSPRVSHAVRNIPGDCSLYLFWLLVTSPGMASRIARLYGRQPNLWLFLRVCISSLLLAHWSSHFSFFVAHRPLCLFTHQVGGAAPKLLRLGWNTD